MLCLFSKCIRFSTSSNATNQSDERSDKVRKIEPIFHKEWGYYKGNFQAAYLGIHSKVLSGHLRFIFKSIALVSLSSSSFFSISICKYMLVRSVENQTKTHCIIDWNVPRNEFAQVIWTSSVLYLIMRFEKAAIITAHNIKTTATVPIHHHHHHRTTTGNSNSTERHTRTHTHTLTYMIPMLFVAVTFADVYRTNRMWTESQMWNGIWILLFFYTRIVR